MKFAASARVSISVPSLSSIESVSLADQRWASRRVRRSEILPNPKEALINAKMRSFAVQANVFLSKPVAHSDAQERMAWVVRRTQMSCGRDTGLRAPIARTPGPRSWRCRDSAPCDSRTGTSPHETHARFSPAPCRSYDCGHAGGPSACRRVWPSPHRPEHTGRLGGALLRVARVALVAIDCGVVIADQAVAGGERGCGAEVRSGRCGAGVASAAITWPA